MKSCGSCAFFTKLKVMKGNGGLCERWDCRANTDGGRRCPDHKRIKFDRLLESKLFREEVCLENSSSGLTARLRFKSSALRS